MTQQVIVFPDAVAVIATYLRTELVDRLQPTHVGSRVPDERPDTFVTVTRVGGSRLNLVADDPLLSIDAWAQTEQAANDLAQLCRGLVNALEGTVQSGVAVYRVAEAGGPVPLPDLSGQPRQRFTVQIALRGSAA